jgi:hypothetical protein
MRLRLTEHRPRGQAGEDRLDRSAKESGARCLQHLLQWTRLAPLAEAHGAHLAIGFYGILIAIADDVAVGVENQLSAILMPLPFRHELHVHAVAQEPNDSKFSQRARRKVGKT